MLIFRRRSNFKNDVKSRITKIKYNCFSISMYSILYYEYLQFSHTYTVVIHRIPIKKFVVMINSHLSFLHMATVNILMLRPYTLIFCT